PPLVSRRRTDPEEPQGRDPTKRQKGKPMTYAEKLAAWREANPKYVGLAEKYGDLLVNTGGNDPLELVADLDLDKNMMRTNVVRFVLAVGVQSQLLVLSKTGTRAEGAPSQAEVREAVRKAGSVNDGWGGLDDSGADRVWHYLTQPAEIGRASCRERGAGRAGAREGGEADRRPAHR